MVFSAELREVVEQRLELPAGAEVEQPCEGASWEGDLGTFNVTCRLEEGVLVHRLELTIPPQRIPADRYPAFAALLRSYDEAANTESRIELQ
jgi:hypothetical protein